ncbi:hypothetical protein PTKIN_Ptkin16aG0061300 [Pterospermum kingtungense]
MDESGRRHQRRNHSSSSSASSSSTGPTSFRSKKFSSNPPKTTQSSNFVPRSTTITATTADNTKNPSYVPRWKSEANANKQQEDETEAGEDVGSIVGTCPFMCPEGERAQRERLRDLAVFERLNGDPRKTSPSLAVKKFCRTISLKYVQASDVRPLSVLEDTLNYLLNLLDSSEHPFEVVHDFIFDRTRSIRQDLSMQNIVNDRAIHMYEKMVKFHVVSHHRLRNCGGSSISSLQFLNMEQLTKTLASLYILYEPNHSSNSIHENEAEFRSLYVLLRLDSKSQQTESLSFWLCRVPSLVMKSKEMHFARQVLRFYRMENYRSFLCTVSAEASNLQYCILEPYVNEINFLLCIDIVLTLLSISFKPALALGNETDRLALLALKDQLVSAAAASPGDGALNSWNDSLNFCDWEGVRCGRRHQRVSTLNLVGLKLAGIISPAIGNLTFLREADLSDNNLKGNIPVEFSHLRRLRYLNLSYNSLQGQLPFELTNCSNLQVLASSHNNLTGQIPFNLGVPPTVYNLSSLTFLDLVENKLSGGLAPELGFAFPKLEIFEIGRNHFTGMIPRSVSNMSSLLKFDIFANNFYGPVPNNLGNLRNLQIFVLDYNHLGSAKAGDLDFVSSLTNCSQLQELVIHRNRFGGVLPTSIANLSTQLQLLFLGQNQISGSIPEGIGNLVNLNGLYMELNFLTGNIPDSIGNLQNLEGLHLPGNSLSGKISSSIGNLTRLSRLVLAGNNFEGTIPLSLSKCKTLQILYLSLNKLIGAIPDSLFGALEGLITLRLSDNSFSGLLPSDFGSLKNLVELSVDHNNFFGEIPEVLGHSTELTVINMQGNSFEGRIPQSFGNLKALQNLDLSGNKLSGVIPLELAKLPFLVSLNLSLNQLDGEVPKEGIFKNVSGFSFFQNKKLCGGIPELKLPMCLTDKKGKVLTTKVVIAMILSILLGSILVVLLVYLFLRQKSGRGLIPVALFEDNFLRLSYKELLEATQGFASSNLIGSGSFGSVYKGFLHQQEKLVAVKVLNLQNRRVARSFLAECKALRKVRHRNLVKIVTSCSSIDYQGNDFKALVFEFMPNGSLESWLHEQHESRRLNLAQRLDIAVDVANAIDYLHHDCETSIVH